jgi:hypothetical protein
LGIALPVLAFAGEPRVQFSMVVTGTITVNPDGGVQDYSLDDDGNLPTYVQQIVQKTIPDWEFVPITADGRAVAASTGMTLRLVADRQDKSHVAIRVAGAEFGCSSWRTRRNTPDVCPAGHSISVAQRKPPRYPRDALIHGVGGEVILVLEVGRDGHVTHAAVRTVNLYTPIARQAHFREILADASLKAARKWTFHPPTTGPGADKDHWVVKVPVNYTYSAAQTGTLLRRRRAPRSQWRAYIPGPVQDIPWDDDDGAGVAGSGDAVAGGAPFTSNPRFVLKTPLAGDNGKS